jgi:hypothetical protein
VRFVLLLLTTIALALGIGFGLSYYALTDGRLFGVAQIGPWTAWPDVGSPTPNPYTRSHLAREAQLQLGQSEGLQFIATTDTDGLPLSGTCNYRIAGRTPLATFWTLVAVDETGANIARPGTALAMRSGDLVRDNNGDISISVGTALAPGSWLETVGAGPFELILTLYDTAAFSGFSDTTAMPAILRGACA